MNIHLMCRNGYCSHTGIVGTHDAATWFRVHQWCDALEDMALERFRSTRCGDQAGQARLTENAVTVVDFFPAHVRGWKMLVRRLRD